MKTTLTTPEAKEAIQLKLKICNIAQLKDIANRSYKLPLSTGNDFLFSAILDELQTRITEKEFVDFTCSLIF